MEYDKIIVRIVTPLFAICVAAGAWWLDRLDQRMHTFETNYVTQTVLESSLKRVEHTIQVSVEGNNNVRAAEMSAIQAWMTRIEMQQNVLMTDIKALIREGNSNGEH